jgi:hypothetical protein
MARYAILDTSNVVVNVAEWDELTPWQPPGGSIVKIPDSAAVDRGWKWAIDTWVPPDPPPEPVPFEEEPGDLG